MSDNIGGGGEMTIAELLRELLPAPAVNLVCKVRAVHELSCDCDPVNGDTEILDVRLVANGSEDRFVLIPKEGSDVVVTMLNNEDAFVSMVSEVDKFYFKNGDTEVDLSAGPLLIKRGDLSLGGLMDTLLNELLKIYAPKDNGALTKLKTDFKTLLA